MGVGGVSLYPEGRWEGAGLVYPEGRWEGAG